MSVLSPEGVWRELVGSGERWADLDGKARLLEETAKTVLAQLVNEEIQGGSSVAKAETVARSSEKYRTHVEAMCIARTEANRARVRYDSAKALFEARRTVAATLRQEMALGSAQT